jgi:hypothetical protein
LCRFISISDTLPDSGSIKVIEIWMLFSLFIPFLEVVLQSYVNYLLHKEDPQENFKLQEIIGEHKGTWIPDDTK